MRITTNTTYAMRCLVYLKDHHGKWVTLQDIAAGTVVPYHYASKILQGLAKAGFVASHKGKSGGYNLRKPPEQISVYDILSAASGGGQILKTACDTGRCGINRTCRARSMWADVGLIAGTYLKSRKLSQL